MNPSEERLNIIGKRGRKGIVNKNGNIVARSMDEILFENIQRLKI